MRWTGTGRGRIGVVGVSVGTLLMSCVSPSVESGGRSESSAITRSTSVDGSVFLPGVQRSTPGTAAPATTANPTTSVASTTSTTTTSTTTTTVAPLIGWDAVDVYLRTTIVGGGSDAMSAAVMRDGELVHAAASGSRTPGGSEPVTTEHRFRIASVSKPIAAITMLQLVQDDVIGLDDPVVSVIAPSLGLTSVPAEVLGITVRQLLMHRSGFAQYEDLFFANGAASCEAAAVVGLTGPLQSVPGTAFQYSNLNFCLIGLAIELLTGQTYQDAVTQRLLTPLGMTGMRLAGTFDVEPLDVEHRSRAGRNYMETLGAAGSWVATASDVVAIINSIDLDTPGWKPLDPSMVNLMRTVTLDPPAPIDEAAGATSTVPPPPPTSGYGLGLMIFGAGSFGHTGTIESTHAMTARRADGYTWAITVSGEYPSSTKALADIMHNALLFGGFIQGEFRPTPSPLER